MNKSTLIATALITSLASAPLFAGHGRDHNRHGHGYDRYSNYDNSHRGRHNRSFTARARVVDVEPILRIVRVPDRHRRCWDEQVQHSGHNGDDVSRGEGLIAGGIIGGVIGNQVGKGEGNKAATVLGTIIGATVGHDMARGSSSQPQSYTTTEQRCHTSRDYYEEERVDGYRVTYRYQGQEFSRRMDHHPGRWVDVQVRISPRY